MMTDAPTTKKRLEQPLLIGAATGLVYGVILRATADRAGSFMSVMTLAFLIVVPAVLGYLTVRPHPNPSWVYRVFAPWLPATASLVFFFFMGWEGGICILMSLPTTLPLASVGGFLGGLRALRRPRASFVAAALPFALAPLESGI